MPFYFRKSVKLGPIRLNFSKSGIGTSVGVKGLRYGVRPNGRAYVHAGRYGIYYRQELGGQSRTRSAPTLAPSAATTQFQVVAASNLPKTSGLELLDLLNESYKRLRLDYLSLAVTVVVAWFGLTLNVVVGVSLAAIGLLCAGWLAWLENRRRTIYLHYPLDGEVHLAFQGIVNGFNALASCSSVWTESSTTLLTTLQEFKQHAGAAQLVGRQRVAVGEGSPPWCDINIPVPTLRAGAQTLYFLPDGILVYDQSGVAHIDYEALKITGGKTRFIEESAPADATVVDHTWRHPNKGGGPDLRFANNSQLPICLYGEAVVTTDAGLCLYLQCSKVDAAAEFESSITAAAASVQLARKHSPEADKPLVTVNPERYQAVGSLLAAEFVGLFHIVKRSIQWIDGGLRRIAGDGNDLVFQFLRVLTVLAICVLLIIGIRIGR